MGESIHRVRVTLTTEVLTTGDRPLCTITNTRTEELLGTPVYVARIAHRAAEAASDDTRLQLAVNYGEVDDEWKVKR
jgi:hypothetical protein